MKYVLLLLALCATTIHAQARPKYSTLSDSDKARSELCSASVGNSIRAKGRPEAVYLRDLLRTAAGVIPEDSPATVKSKTAAFWKNPQVTLDEPRGVNCHLIHAFGTIVWASVNAQKMELVKVLIDEGADINMVDPHRGTTALDELVTDYQHNVVDHEANWIEPTVRRQYWSTIASRRSQYEQLRAWGARHAFELKQKEPDLASEEAACLKNEPGDEPRQFAPYGGGLATKMGALTPKMAPGAITVSVRQAACLMRAYKGELFLAHAMSDQTGIPGARRYPRSAVSGSFDDNMQINFINENVKHDLNVNYKAVLTYCHSDHCFLSYNATQRLAHAGVKKIFWMRDGIKAWKEAGYPVVPVQPY